MPSIIIPTLVGHLGAVLGLLFTWRQHQLKQEAGVTTYQDISNPSGIRFYLYVTPGNPDRCSFCRETDGCVRIAVPSSSQTPVSACETPDVCMGVWLAFSGGWLEANHLLRDLRATKGQARMLTSGERKRFQEWEWHVDATHPDRLNLHWMAALSYERTQPAGAIKSYTAIIDGVSLIRHRPLLGLAYLRLAGLLARRGEPKKALAIIAHCERRYAKAELGTLTLTGKQRRALETMKPYLYTLVDSNMTLANKPAQLQGTDRIRSTQGK